MSEEKEMYIEEKDMSTEEKDMSMEEKDMPTTEQILKELRTLRRKEKKNSILRNTINSLIVVAAIAVIISYVFLPVMKVTGTSMSPSLINGDILLCVKSNSIKSGDIVAFYYNNKVLVKRVIGTPGDNIDIDEKGNVKRNGKTIDEPYVKEKTKGICDMQFPYQVPENRLFVMGDNRGVSIDSRSVTIGCISDEYIIGKVLLRIYPLNAVGKP